MRARLRHAFGVTILIRNVLLAKLGIEDAPVSRAFDILCYEAGFHLENHESIGEPDNGVRFATGEWNARITRRRGVMA
jgi:hypothetical protein